MILQIYCRPDILFVRGVFNTPTFCGKIIGSSVCKMRKLFIGFFNDYREFCFIELRKKYVAFIFGVNFR